MVATPYYAGSLLLAMPGIGDTRFERAVIAMCVHDGDGAMGIGIGRGESGISLHELMRQLDIDPIHCPDVPVLAGGPVEPRRGFVIHSRDWGGEGTIDVAGGWALSASIDILRAIAEGRGPTRYIVALGYAGWSAGQLEGEMTRHGWLVVPASLELLFDVPADQRWQAALGASGIDAAHLSGQSGRA